MIESDVLIIGGGIAGLSAAARLAPFARVIVLERESQLSYHASGRSAAVFIKDYGNDIVRALNAASFEYLSKEKGGVLSPRGMMMLAKADERQAFEREAKDFGLEYISAQEARQRVPLIHPERVAFAGFSESAQDIDTDLLLQRFSKEARAHGGEIMLSSGVESISRHGDSWYVRAGSRDFSAQLLVNASGAWADQVALMAGVSPLGFTPYRRSMARIPVPGGFDPASWPLLDGVGEGWYAKPDAGQLIVSPADEDPMEPQDAWADDTILAQGLANFEEMMSAPVRRMTANWAGLRTFAPDRSLVIGRSPQCRSFFWLCGQGGYGFQTAAAASALAHDLILGRQNDLPRDIIAALSPDRFDA